MPGDAVFPAGEELFGRLEHMHDLLSDPGLTSIRMVLNLERMVIKEAQRAFTYFHLYGYPTDLVICNRVVPDDAGAYFEAWRAAQARYRPRARQLRARPNSGGAVLRGGGGGQGDAAAARHGGVRRCGPDRLLLSRAAVQRAARRWRVRALARAAVHLQQKVHLSRCGDELVVVVGSWRRNLILPRVLVDLPTAGAGFDDHVLKVRFAAKAAQQGRSVEAMTDLEDQLAQLEQRLAAVEARRARAPRGLIGLWRAALPPKVRAHLRAARKERRLAARAFLDHRIERLEKEPAEALRAGRASPSSSACPGRPVTR